MRAYFDVVFSVAWLMLVGHFAGRMVRPRRRHIWGELESTDVMLAHRRRR